MADTKISLLTPISAPQNPSKMYVPLFAEDGTPLNARMNFSEIFKTPVQMNLNATVANSAVIFSTPADGRLLLTDYAGTSFGRLQLGGITNAYPSLKRNATGIDFRLADDSGFAPITAAAIVSSSTIAATGAVSGTKFTASNTVTTSNPAIDAAQTWNAVGVAFTGIKFNASGDATSAAGSKLLDLQLEAASKFVVDKAGNTSITPAWSGTGTATTPLLVNVTADPGPANNSSNLLALQIAGSNKVEFRKNGAMFLSGVQLVATDGTLGYYFGGPGGTWLGASGQPLYLFNNDLALQRDNADTLAQRRTSNPQLLRLYELYVGTSDYSRAVFGFRDSAGNTMGTPALRIGTEKAGSGTARDLAFITDDTVRMVIYGGGGINTGGNAITAYKLQQTSSRLEIQAPETIPASATAGNAGSICYDSDYIYVAVSSGSWKRVALSAF